MKIVLISPSGAMHRYKGSFKKSLHYAPLTLITLAALIPKELNADIKIYDETVEKIPLNIEADIIGISIITGTADRGYAYADFYRRKGITVVLGGIHATLFPEEAQRYSDSVVIGFGENNWSNLLLDFKDNKLKKIYNYNKSVKIDNIIPRRDLLKKNSYLKADTIEVIRGCPNDCIFCAASAAWNRKYYTKSIKHVVNEISQLKNEYLIIPDVNLIPDFSYSKRFFKELSYLNKKWFGLVTTDVIEDEEMFKYMVKSGCKGVLIGFESILNNSLESMNKSFNSVQKYKDLIKKLHDNGIAVNGTFVFGNDEETKDVFKKTVDFVNEIQIDLPRFSLMTPFPGTSLYEKMNSENRIIEKNWAMYDTQHSVIKPKNMTATELEEGLFYAWKNTYKFNSVYKRLKYIPDLPFIVGAANLGYRYYARKLKKFDRLVMIDNSDIK